MAGVMPDLSLSELILGGLATLFGGGAGAQAVARGKNGDEFERRVARLDKRLAQTEERMHSIEKGLAVLSRLGESSERTWHAIEALQDKIDRLMADVVRLHVETTVERKLRQQQANTEEDTDP